MADFTTPVTGPFRIHVKPAPLGVELDLSHYLATLVLELAQQADEDGESLLDELRAIAELDRSAQHRGIDAHATHERDSRVDEFLEGLCAGSVPVHGMQALRLADALRGVVVPRQQGRGAA